MRNFVPQLKRRITSRLSLRTRLTLSVMAIALLSTVGVAAVAFFYVTAHTLETISVNQMQRTVAIAESVDQKFASRRVLLKSLAQSMELQQIAGAVEVQAFIVGHPVLSEMFANVLVSYPSGRSLANYLTPKSVGQISIADRPYFIETLARNTGVISQPIKNRLTGLPQVVMTQPVHDKSGAIVYVVSALITLDKPDFLGKFADLKFGESGYVFIINTDGILIDTPRKERILRHFNAEGGENRAVAMAVDGYEGSMQGVNQWGIRALYAFKKTEQTNWVIATNYPYTEALAALNKVESLTALGAIGLTLLVGGFSLFLLRRELSPLGRLQQHMLKTHAAEHHVPIAKAFGDDEIGDLARTFDILMTEREAAQERQEASRKLLQDIADNMPSLIQRVDVAMRYTFVNARVKDTYPEIDLLGKPMREVRGELEYQIIEPWATRALSGESVTFEKDGAPGSIHEHCRFEMKFIPDRDAHGQVVGFYSMSFDITDRKRAEHAVAASAAKLRLITDNTPALISHLDIDEAYTFTNGAIREWWGREPDSVLQVPIRNVIGESVYAHVAPIIKRSLAGERIEYDWPSERNGVTRFAHTVFVPERDEVGTVVGVFLLTIDTSQLKAAERKLAQQARVDSLTGVANRLAFNEEIPNMLARARRSADALVLMYLDIDYFKKINDTLGHAAGDEVLCEFARRLQACVRSTDLVVRLGGDEFIVVMDHVCELGLATTLAQKIVDHVARPVFEVADTSLVVTTSMGVVFHPHTAGPTTPDEVLARADAALYAAKAAGRNRFELAKAI